MGLTRRRDRHGRGMRGPLASPRLPTMLSPSERFEAYVLEAMSAIEAALGEQLSELEVAVEDVPPSDPSPWETTVALGRAFPATAHWHARVILYRRPIETRAPERDDLRTLIWQVLAGHIATLIGVDPDDLA